LLFVGDDWAEDYHDVEIQDEAGRKLAARRLPEGAAGIARLHELIAVHLGGDGDPGQVAVAIETDRGLWVQALVAAGYQVYGLNPKQVARFKERYGTSGAKSDPLTELRGGLGQVSGRLGVWVSTVADRGHRRGCAAGFVAAGGAAARVA
jgi:transposase